MHAISRAANQHVRVSIIPCRKNQRGEGQEHLSRELVWGYTHPLYGEAEQIGDGLVAGVVPRHINGAITWPSGAVDCQVQPHQVAKLALQIGFELGTRKMKHK